MRRPAPRRRLRWAWLWGLLLPACSWTLDSEAPDVQLVGAPKDRGSLVQLNAAPAGGVSILLGADGAPWAALDETPQRAFVLLPGTRPATDTVIHLVRLLDPPAEEVLRAPQVALTGRDLLLQHPMLELQPTQIVLHRPGEAGPGVTLTAPPGKLALLVSGDSQIVGVWVLAATTRTFTMYRRDGTLLRELPVPPGVDPENPQGKGRLLFSSDGQVLFAAGADGRVVAHGLTDGRDVDLGAQPAGFLVDPSRTGPAILVCDAAGVRSVPADGGAAATIVTGVSCEPDLLQIRQGAVLFQGSAQPGAAGAGAGRAVWRAALSGGPVEQIAPAEARQILALGPVGVAGAGSTGGAVCYSTDPASLYGAGVGAGWLGGWGFMERGRNVSFSADGTRLRWLERAANSDGVGELLSAQVPGGAPLHLGLNVRQYAEVAPGKVLAIGNAAYKGTQNRLVLIDESARTARWVLGEARDFQFIPGTDDALVRLVAGSAFDVVRVPIPR